MQLFCIEDRRAPFIDVYVRSATAAGHHPVLLRPEGSGPSKYQALVAAYQHLSVNPQAFELACFRRYFEVLLIAPPHLQFAISDSDLLFPNPNSRLADTLLDYRDGIVGSVGITGGVPERDVSPHFSLWTKPQLASFTDFILFVYQQRFESLQQEYQRRADAKHKRVAISDMSLLGMWIRGGHGKLLNSNVVGARAHIDHNISMGECHDGQFETQCGVKRLILGREGQLMLRTRDGCTIVPHVLHLQGRAKLVAEDLEKRRLGRARIKMLVVQVARRLRAALQ